MLRPRRNFLHKLVSLPDFMDDAREPTASLSGLTKFGYGLALPVLVLFFCEAALLHSLSSSGSWDGMGLAIATVISVPGILVANGWVLPLRWSARRHLFAAGLALPAVLLLVEYLWLYGGPFRRIINAAFVAPFLWIWLFVLLLFLPLIASIVHRTIQNRRYPPGRDPAPP
jgi:hypothetical protein